LFEKLVENINRNRKGFVVALIQELAKLEGFPVLPGVKFRSYSAVCSRYRFTTREVEIAPRYFTIMTRELERENIKGAQKALWDIVCHVAHEFSHFMHHAATGWDAVKAFPSWAFRLPHRDRPHEKVAMEYHRRIALEFMNAVLGYETRLKPFVDRWSRG